MENQNKELNEIQVNNENKESKKKIYLVLILSLGIGIAYLFYWLLIGRNYESTDNAYVNSSQTIVTSQVEGNITNLNIEDTQIVKEGDLLLEIDDTDYKINLEKASANLAKVIRSYSSLVKDVETSKANLIARESDMKKADEDLKRDQESYKLGLISKMELDNTQNIYDVAVTALKQGKEALNNAKNQAKIQNDIRNHPDVKDAIINYKKASLDLIRTKVYASTSGTIAKKSVFIGQRVTSNQNLFSIINLDSIWVDANLKEDQLKNVKIGNEVELKSDFNGKKYKGYVKGISGGTGSSLSVLPAQNATGNWIKIVQRVPVKIILDKEILKEKGVLPIGTSMEATISLKSNSDYKSDPISLKSNLYSLQEKEIDCEIEKIIKENLADNNITVKQ
ncbi:MAG: HlyD family secretion protein [Fusobacteriaceae bacterium]|nr:HlyD family secretion protein [Fusobacteriaceae bacterium]